VPFICQALHHTAHPWQSVSTAVRLVHQRMTPKAQSGQCKGKQADSPVVSTVLARPARRSLVEILRATSSKSFSCTRGNTAAFNGATAGLNLHIATPHLKSAYHAGAGLNLLHHLMTEMQLEVMQPGHVCVYLHDARPWLLFHQHASSAVLRNFLSISIWMAILHLTVHKQCNWQLCEIGTGKGENIGVLT